uniref:Uncharacterized protein n=1 Tax=Parascaris univalens TaxID=6257 RepID=A0A915C0C3_PARUN
GMINLRNWYIITSLDTISDSMEPYSHNMMRIGLATIWDEQHAINVLGERHHFYYEHFVNSWKSMNRHREHTPYRQFGLIFDAVLVACRLHANTDSHKQRATINGEAIPPTISMPFDEVIREGLTGPIRFDSSNRRVDSKIFVWELGIDGIPINTGIWKSNAALSQRQLSMHDKELPNTHERVLRERKTQRLLKVTSIIERPYVMPKGSVNGVIEYEGFCVDLLDKLAEYLNFEYMLYIVKDGKYGEPINATTEWSGMIGEILHGNADMAVAPITVTARRLEVVDFTDPFLQLGISMLMRQPDRATSSSLTSFLWPLSGSVWMYSAFATIGTALSVIIVSLISPAESADEFNITNSVWYLVCILLRAGSGYNCGSVSNRLISTVWWS